MECLQFVQGADDDEVAIHGEVGPGFGVGDFLFGEEFEFGGVGLDEVEDAFFIEREEAAALGDQAPVFAELAVGYPILLAAGEVEAGEFFVAEMHEDFAAEHDGGGHVAFRFVLPCQGDAGAAGAA